MRGVLGEHLSSAAARRAGEPCSEELQRRSALLLLGPILSAALSFSSAHFYLRA